MKIGTAFNITFVQKLIGDHDLQFEQLQLKTMCGNQILAAKQRS